MFEKVKKFLIAQTVLAFTFVFAHGTACAKIDRYAGMSLELTGVPAELAVGGTAEISAVLTGDDAASAPATFKWKSLNPGVLSLKEDGDKAVLTAIKGGKASVVVYLAECEKVNAKATVVVSEEGDGVLRILAIGNSFSQDAVEQYLYELFAVSGQKVIIGNLYIGGCSLEKHYNNMMADSPAYEYRKIVDGQKTNVKGVRVSAALADEKWDYVSLQQASGLSGQYETCTPYLPEILNYVRSHSRHDVKLMWHSTWAYSSDSTHSDFPKYQSDQDVMYNAIIDVAKKIMGNASYSFDILIPCGTAIQNGRTSSLGDSFNRDGYHLEVNYGRYAAACTWFEAISGKNAEDTVYAPASVNAETARIVRSAVHDAVMNPYGITDQSNVK